MSSSHGNLATRYRHSLADALLTVGQSAPTLCAGWTAHDLAAHLVVREAPTLTLPVNLPTRHDADALADAKNRPFEQLVADFRAGPPRWSPFGLPGVDSLVNVVEYAVHLIDVTRGEAVNGQHPNPALLAREHDLNSLWQTWQLPLIARSSFRKSPAPVAIVTSGAAVGAIDAETHADGMARIVKAGVPRAVLLASTADVLLLASGRARYANWTVTGPEQQAHALDYWLDQRKRANATESAH